MKRISYNDYQKLIESVHDIVFKTNVDGKWVFLNKSWTRVLGYSTEESIGTPFSNYLHPDDQEREGKLFLRLINGEKTHCRHEVRYVHQSGAVVWMNVHAILRTDDAGRVLGTTGTLRDITDDKKNRKMVQLLSENCNDLICVHDTDGRYQYVSPSITAITGYSPNDLLGKDPYDFIHPDDVRLIKTNHQSVIADTGADQTYIIYRFKILNNSYRWFETSTKSVVNEKNEIFGIVTSSRIIDSRKNAEEQIILSLQKERELSQIKSRFVNFVSHEFRTPLASIYSSMELMGMYLERDQLHAGTFKKHIDNVILEIDRLSALVSEVLAVGKIESNAFTCKKEPICLVELLESTIRSVQQIQTDGRVATFHTMGTQVEVLADAMIIRHAVSNLVSNAFKYSPNRPAPVVTLIFQPDHFIINVKDAGIGIPKEDQQNIFNGFFRASNVFDIQGTGLGLFISNYLVNLHGGKLEFTSDIDSGSEFTATFPCS